MTFELSRQALALGLALGVLLGPARGYRFRPLRGFAPAELRHMFASLESPKVRSCGGRPVRLPGLHRLGQPLGIRLL